MQRFISEVVWDEAAILKQYHSLVGNDMGDPAGVLIIDESGCAKKGDDSAGVAKQYCGSLGKGENCQVGVFAAYASPQGYALLDTELFVPEKWFEESHKEKRAKCKFPPGFPGGRQTPSKNRHNTSGLGWVPKEGVCLRV